MAIVTETYPPEINGVAMTICRMVEGLRLRGHEVQLIRPRQSAAERPVKTNGFEEVLLRGIAIPRYDCLKIGLPACRALMELWTSKRPDVVHLWTRDAGRPIWERAAGIYISILRKPQLFIEGNHRTGALILSYALLKAGKPPFILRAANAQAYFAASGSFRNVPKNGVAAFLRVPGMRRRFAQFLLQECGSEHLCHA